MLRRWLESSEFSRLQMELRHTGKVIVRSAPVRDLSEVSTVAAAVWGEEHGIMAEYTHGSTTRDQLGNGVLQVNLEPPEAPVLAHTEMTYLDHFPTYIAFYVKVPAPVGGKTIVTDNLAVTRALSEGGVYRALGDKLRLLGVEFSRHLSCEFVPREERTQLQSPDPLQYKTWQDAFSTSDRDAAEQSLADSSAGTLSWLESGGAVWRSTRPAFSWYPASDEVVGEIFMSQLFAMHCAGNSLVGSVHEADVKSLANAGLLPYHSRWGDGSEFSSEEMSAFNELHQTSYAEELELVSGDMVILDNFRWCHGRSPYEGNRELFVAMSRPVGRTTAHTPAGV
jgi:hypothetical protein